MNLYSHFISTPTKSSKAKLFSPFARLPTIRHWIETLPITNYEKVAQVLSNALNQVHTADITDNKRYDILLILEPTIETVCYLLQQKTLTNIPLPAKEISTLNQQAQNLQIKIAAEFISFLQKNGTKLSQEQLLTTMSHALKHLGLTLLYYYQHYMPIPKHIWQRLHFIYHFAEKRNCENIFIPDIDDRKISISQEYTRLLLFALANPYQLSRPDIEMIYQALFSWAIFANLHTEQLQDSSFVVTLDKNEPPCNQVILASAKPNANWRFINTSALLIYIKKLLQNPMQHQINEPTLTTTLLKHLLRAWGTYSARNFVRLQQTGLITIAFGLAGANYYMLDSEQLKYTLPINFTPPDSTRNLANDPWHPIYTPAKNAPSLKQGRKYYKSLTKSALMLKNHMSGYFTHQWHLINSCASGYCLITETPPPLQILIGEIIGIKNSADPQSVWQIGAIQWMSHTTKNHLQIGVQLLATYATPIFLRHYPNQPLLRGLLLPAQTELSQAATLVIPALLFQAGDKLQIIEGEKQYQVKLSNQLHASTYYKQFDFEIIEINKK